MNTVRSAARWSLSLPAAGAAGVMALTLLAPAASAQAVGGVMRSGGGRQQAAPAQPQAAPQQSQPAPVQPTPVQSPVQTAPVYSGPAVTVPDAFSAGPTMRPGIRYRDPRPTQSYTNTPVPSSGGGTYQGAVPIYPGQNYSGQINVTTTRPGRQRFPTAGRGNNYTNTLPPVGPANGFFNDSTPPVGPANGYFGSNGVPNLRLRTPAGPRYVPPSIYRNNYLYGPQFQPGYAQGYAAPPLLGGYYYSNYCDAPIVNYTYPSVYAPYSGFPQYIYNSGAGIITIGTPYSPVYVTSYLPFYAPSYQVNYNQTNYYVANEGRARDLEAGGDRAKAALQDAYPADSYQAAFGEIARAWLNGNIRPLHRHLKDTDTRISVSLNKKYAYSIASGDFEQITRDALDRLDTVSFEFTRLRKAKNDDVTAYGTHVYRSLGSDSSGIGTGGGSQDDGTVPFDRSGDDGNSSDSNRRDRSPYDRADDPALGERKTVYVSYTLRHRDDQWYIIAVDSSDQPLVPQQ